MTVGRLIRRTQRGASRPRLIRRRASLDNGVRVIERLHHFFHLPIVDSFRATRVIKIDLGFQSSDFLARQLTDERGPFASIER